MPYIKLQWAYCNCGVVHQLPLKLWAVLSLIIVFVRGFITIPACCVLWICCQGRWVSLLCLPRELIWSSEFVEGCGVRQWFGPCAIWVLYLLYLLKPPSRAPCIGCPWTLFSFCHGMLSSWSFCCFLISLANNFVVQNKRELTILFGHEISWPAPALRALTVELAIFNAFWRSG